MNIHIKGDTMSEKQAFRLAEVIRAYGNFSPNVPVLLCSSSPDGKMAILELANGVDIVSDANAGVIYFAHKDEGTTYYDDYEEALERQNYQTI